MTDSQQSEIEALFGQVEQIISEGRDLEAAITQGRYIPAESYISTEEERLAFRKFGVAITEAGKFLAKAKDAQSAQRPERVRSSAKIARRMAEKVRDDLHAFFATKLIGHATEVFQNANALGIDPSALEDTLHEAQAQLEAEQYAAAEAGATQILDGIDTLKREYMLENAWNRVLEAERAIDEIKEIGANIDTAEKWLEAAKAEYNSENFEQSETYVKQALKEAHKAKGGKLHPKLQARLTEVQRLINTGQKYGLSLEKAQMAIVNAVGAFNEGAVDKAQELVEEAAGHYTAVARQFANQELVQAQNELGRAKQFDIDIEEARAVYDEAQKVYEDEDYLRAIALTRNERVNILKRLNRVRYQQIATGIRACHQKMVELHQQSIDVGHPQKLLTESTNELKAGNYDAARKYLDGANEALEELTRRSQSKLAQRQLDMVEKLIQSATQKSIAINDAERTLVQARSRFENEDYDAAVELAKKADAAVSEAVQAHEAKSTYEAIVSFEKLIEKVQDPTVTETGGEYIARARKLYESGEYGSAKETLNIGEKALRDALKPYLFEKATEAISSAQSELMAIETRNLEVDLSAAEELLSQARTAFQAGEYQRTEQLAIQAIELGRHRERAYTSSTIGREIERLAAQLDELKANGAKTGAADQLLDEVRSAHESGDFDSARSGIEQLNNTLQRAGAAHRKKMVHTRLESLRGELEALEAGGQPLPHGHELLDAASEALSEKRFDAADTRLGQLEDLLAQTKEQAEYDRVDAVVETAREVVAKCREYEVDVPDAVRMLDAAEKNLQLKKFGSAADFAKRAKQRAEKALIPFMAEMTKDSLEETQKEIAEAKAAGIDLEGVDEYLSYAKAGVAEGNLELASDYIDKIHEVLQIATDEYYLERAEDLMIEVRDKIKEGKAADIDVSLPENLLNNADYYFELENYKLAYTNAKDAWEKADRAVSQHFAKDALELLSQARETIQRGVEADIDMSDAQRLLERATSMFEASDYTRTESFARSALRWAKEAESKHKSEIAEKWLERFDEDLDEAEQCEYDMSEYRKLYRQAERYYEEKEYGNALRYATHGTKQLEEFLSGHYQRKFADIIQFADRKISSIQTMGVDPTEPQKLYDRAQELYDAGEYKRAYTTADQVRIAAKEATVKHLQSNAETALDEATSIIEQAQEAEIDVEGAEYLYNQAKEAFDEELYDRAERYANQAARTARNKTHHLLSEHAQTVIETAAEKLAQAQRMELMLPEVEGLLEQADDAFARDDFSAAEQYGVRASTAAEGAIRQAYARRAKQTILSAKKTIEEMTQQGRDASRAQQYLDYARTLFTKQEYEQAEEYAKAVVTIARG